MKSAWKTLIALPELERGPRLPGWRVTALGPTYPTPTKLLKVSDITLMFHTLLTASFILFIACVVKGSGICFPVVANCEPHGILPDYVVNQNIYLLENVLNRRELSNFSIVYNVNQSEFEACFTNVTQDINFVEFCTHHATCTSSIPMPSVDGEFTILKSAKIEVGKGVLNKQIMYCMITYTVCTCA